MEPIQMETTGVDTSVSSVSSESGCSTCKKAAQAAAQNEETSLAFLLALVPVISLTFFGQIGLL